MKFDKEGKFTGKETEKPSVQSHVRGLLVDLEYAKAEDVLALNSETATKLPTSPKHRINLRFSASANVQPTTIDIWLAGENPELIYVKYTGGKSLYKAKRSIISSLSEKTAVLPASDATPAADVGLPHKG